MVIVRPVCARCSRAARTVDTPRVKVRVDRVTVIRRDLARLVLLFHCHGDGGEITFMCGETGLSQPDEVGLNEWLERIEVFRGD